MSKRCPFVAINAVSKSADVGSLTEPDKGQSYGSYLFWNANSESGGKWTVEDKSVHLGLNSAIRQQAKNIIALGAYAGQNSQDNAIAIGTNAGQMNQQSNSIAIGTNAGQTIQLSNSIAIGSNAGQTTQESNSIAIGTNAGQTIQLSNSIAIGSNAGQINQESNSIAIGSNAGQTGQKTHAIAIGANAGQLNQGEYSIAIGVNAGQTGQAANSIIICAGPTGISTSESGFYVNPIRGPRGAWGVLAYDLSTNEIFLNGSSRRYKYDIIPLENDTSTIYQLEPREFKYKLSGKTDIGLIAEEVYQIDPSLVYLNNGEPEGIQWNTITTYLLQELQKLKIEVDELESCIK
jgi:hypothetical protein